jgi:Tol biopolymer transport system component/C-terminal processing protease CtpA/Prc
MVIFRSLYTFALALSLVSTTCLTARAMPYQSTKPNAAGGVPYFTEPVMSPDRSEIAFVSGGDIWTVPAAGGEGRLLVSNPANETRPLYSPDGNRLAFISTRTGNGDIYVLTFETGELKRLTFDDGVDQLDAWSRDGKWVYFSSTSRDIAGMNDIFRVNAEGGTPMQVSADRYANEYWSAPSPDGKSIAFTARGISSAQWWRKGHSHLDESEIWLMHDGSPPAYEQVTEGGAKEMWPMWSADGQRLFYVSDRSGAQNVWSRPLPSSSQKAQQITRFKEGRVLWPSISYDGRTIVFEHNFSIWKLDTANGQTSEVPITRRGAPAGPSVEHLTLNNQFQEFTLSPDGKKIAFVVRGEIFAASAKDGGDAARVTNSPASESQVTWSPDSRRIAYVSEREGDPRIYLYDFSNGSETQLTPDTGDWPRFSPDGKMIAFQRQGRELRVIDLNTKQERLLATASLGRPPLFSERPFSWSPDSRWIAFMPSGGKLFKNVYVVAATGGTSQPISFLANSGGGTISWSPDGTFILFDTGQRTESFQIARVDLIPRTPRFREDQFRELFREETPKNITSPNQPPQETKPSPTEPQREPQQPSTPPADEQKKDEKKPVVKPVEIVPADIRQRLSMIPVGLDVDYQTISPDGKWLLVIASAAGQQNLYVYPLDELSKEPAIAKQLTSTQGNKRSAQFSPDSKEVYYLEQGRINVIPLDTRQARPLAVTAEMDVDFTREKVEVFNQAWRYIRDTFYDPNFHGVNWQAMHDEYAPLVAGARTSDEMRRLIALMLGELNASHSGISAPFAGVQFPTGRLGLRFDRAEYESSGRLRVSDIIPLSPAALAKEIKPGDYLLAVDSTPITARTNLDELLNFKVNRRVALTISSSADGALKREIAVRCVNGATEKGLMYRRWVEENRAYVARVSGGKLGYVHMFDMGSGSLSQLYVDLDAENHGREGVIIDIRNNNGGFVNAYALDVFSRRPYMTMTPRGSGSAPARTLLGQRALESPTVLVINQHSLSDAEDFTEGYRTLKLGKVIGEPTAGWIIYTSGTQLVDGSTLRLPFIKITGSDGGVMELNPRQVDVAVKRPIGESYTAHDSQLDAAVRELLKEIGTREKASKPDSSGQQK